MIAHNLSLRFDPWMLCVQATVVRVVSQTAVTARVASTLTPVSGLPAHLDRGKWVCTPLELQRAGTSTVGRGGGWFVVRMSDALAGNRVLFRPLAHSSHIHSVVGATRWICVGALRSW